MEQFEMTVYSSEHITLLTKVLMMFSRRRVDVVSVKSESNRKTSSYHITFNSGRDEAFKLQKQIQKAVDILDAKLHRVDFEEAKRINIQQDYQLIVKAV